MIHRREREPSGKTAERGHRPRVPRRIDPIDLARFTAGPEPTVTVERDALRVVEPRGEHLEPPDRDFRRIVIVNTPPSPPTDSARLPQLRRSGTCATKKRASSCGTTALGDATWLDRDMDSAARDRVAAGSGLRTRSIGPSAPREDTEPRDILRTAPPQTRPSPRTGSGQAIGWLTISITIVSALAKHRRGRPEPA